MVGRFDVFRNVWEYGFWETNTRFVVVWTFQV